MRATLIILIFTGLVFDACKSKIEKLSEQQNQEMKTASPDKFVINHTFEADVDTVFTMWTNPDVYVRWMGPAGAEMSFVQADVREGGEALWQMTTPDGLTKYGKLHYKTINPARQFAYVQNFSDQDGNFIKAPFSATYPDSLLLTVDFNSQANNAVLMTVTWEIVGEPTEAERKTFNDMKPFMVKGWSESFEKIEAMLKLVK